MAALPGVDVDVALVNNVLKTNNVMGKLTKSNHSSRSVSPCSHPSSRTSSPDGKPVLLNGQMKHLTSVSPSGDAAVVSNGNSVDGVDCDISGGGDNPAKQARLQIDKIEKQHEKMLETAIGERGESPGGKTSSEMDIITNGDLDATLSEMPSELQMSEASNTVTISKEKDLNLPNTQECDKENTVEVDIEAIATDNVATDEDSTKPPRVRLTLNDKAKDNFKEILKAAVAKFTPDKQSPLSKMSPISAKNTVNIADSTITLAVATTCTPNKPTVDKGNLFENMSADFECKTPEAPQDISGIDEAIKLLTDNIQMDTKDSTADDVSKDSEPMVTDETRDTGDTKGDATEETTTSQPILLDEKSVSEDQKKRSDEAAEEALLLGEDNDNDDNMDIVDEALLLDEEDKKEVESGTNSVKIENGASDMDLEVNKGKECVIKMEEIINTECVENDQTESKACEIVKEEKLDEVHIGDNGVLNKVKTETKSEPKSDDSEATALNDDDTHKRKLSLDSTSSDAKTVKKIKFDDEKSLSNDSVPKTPVINMNTEGGSSQTSTVLGSPTNDDVVITGQENGTRKIRQDHLLRVTRKQLEKMISKKVAAMFTTEDSLKLVRDLQSRCEKLTLEMTRWKETAKKYQAQVVEVTKSARPERRRSARGPVRHVAIQVDATRIQAGQIGMIQKTPPRPVNSKSSTPETPVVPKASVGIPVLPQPATIILPVAGASANGTVTLLAPSTLPTASANIASGQYKYTLPTQTTQPVQNRVAPPGSTVRDILNKQTDSTVPIPTPTPINSKPTEKVIDLTDDDDGAAKALLTSTGQVLLQVPGTPAMGIRPGTFIVPVSGGQAQSIILQPLMGQALRSPIMYTGVRPAIAPLQQPSTALAPRVPTPTPTTVSKPSRGRPAASTINNRSSTARASKHPAPLPPQPTSSKHGPGLKEMPPKPSLKISRVPQGIVLSWNMNLITDATATISNYQLFAYQEGSSPPYASLWKRVGDVKALPLPMACTLTQFHEGNKYHFTVRGVDEHGRIGPFSDASSIHLEASIPS